MGERFWYVMGRGLPTYRHPTYSSAEQEAQRLARLDRGQEFLVLEAVAKVKTIDVVVERLGRDIDSELPF